MNNLLKDIHLSTGNVKVTLVIEGIKLSEANCSFCNGYRQYLVTITDTPQEEVKMCLSYVRNIDKKRFSSHEGKIILNLCQDHLDAFSDDLGIECGDVVTNAVEFEVTLQKMQYAIEQSIFVSIPAIF